MSAPLGQLLALARRAFFALHRVLRCAAGAAEVDARCSNCFPLDTLAPAADADPDEVAEADEIDTSESDSPHELPDAARASSSSIS